MNLLRHSVACSLLLTLSWTASMAEDSTNKTLLFDVFLDGKKIGYHRFEIDGQERNAAVRSEASFDVKFLFVTAFSYRHSAYEYWTGGASKKSRRAPIRTAKSLTSSASARAAASS